MRMFNLAVILIALGAVIGLYMAAQHFRGHTVSGVIVLLIAARESGLRGAGPWALWLFGIAALGGLYLATQHMDQKRLSSGIIVVHAVIAVAAFLITLTAVYLVP
jgi:hypothetical protein